MQKNSCKFTNYAIVADVTDSITILYKYYQLFVSYWQYLKEHFTDEDFLVGQAG